MYPYSHAMNVQSNYTSGIHRIVYESDKYNGVDTNIASKRMLKAAGVELVQLKDTIHLNVEKIPNPELQKIWNLLTF